jgi:hypothetical protein
MSVVDLVRDLDRDTLREYTGLIKEFDTWDAAATYLNTHGRLEYTICCGIGKAWAVRPKSEGEKERDAYWREYR